LLLVKASAASARARQTLLGVATAAMDNGIASLQRLRTRAGATDYGDERRDQARPGTRAPREGTRAPREGTRAPKEGTRCEPAAAEAVAPEPRRRLRGLLVYLSVMLAGGMGGMALAYDLFARMLEQRSAELKRQEMTLTKYSKSIAELERKLSQQQTTQLEAEARLAAALTDNEAKLAELQAKRTEAETRLASALAVRAGNSQQQTAAGNSRGAARSGRTGWTKAGNCTLGSGNVRSALQGCIADMDRK
jgi:hypothetical protein